MGTDRPRRPDQHELLALRPGDLHRRPRHRPVPRGKYELADAVQHAIDVLGERFEVVPAREGVLDLSMRSDIPSVARRLSGFEVRL